MVLILVGLLALAGCGGGGDSGGGRTVVVAGVYPLAWAAEQIGGDAVDVTNLTPPGAEPHDVELSARDVERVRDADLVLLVGSGFQPALEDAAAAAEGETFDALDGLELLGSDPHVWLDPLRFADVVRRLGVALGGDSEAGRLAGRIEALHREYRDGLRGCGRREFVTSHAAFAYLADRYRLEQVAIAGLSPEAEPTPRDLEETVERVRRAGATTIFFETLVSPRIAEAVARETGAETAVLNPLEGLTREELERGEDYVSVMRANLAALREALRCR